MKTVTLPTRPVYISRMIRILGMTQSWDVMPVDRPTVPSAEKHSNRMFFSGSGWTAAITKPAPSAMSAAEKYAKEREGQLQQLEAEQAEQQTELNNAPIVQLVRSIIEQAVRQRASDIHFDALEKQVRVRYRIDGVLAEKMLYDINLLPAIVTRIKIMSGMDISEKRKPQDGRITMAQLKQGGNTLVSLAEANALNKEVKINLFAKKPKPRDLAVFCRQFVSIVSAGVPVINALGMDAYSTDAVVTGQLTYPQLKSVISYLYAGKTQTSLNSVAVSFNAETGGLTGTFDIARYYVNYPGAVYTPEPLPEVALGVTDLFGTSGAAGTAGTAGAH